LGKQCLKHVLVVSDFVGYSGVCWTLNISKPSFDKDMDNFYHAAVHKLDNKIANNFSFIYDKYIPLIRVKCTDNLRFEPTFFFWFPNRLKGIMNGQGRKHAAIRM